MSDPYSFPLPQKFQSGPHINHIFLVKSNIYQIPLELIQILIV